ncbi:uncharacterized protein LOC110240578 [Exaiptasia diaphana]|uniref:CUB domain-containing protein n=1 Tax=Exaiptasia diaphana TaxID=2652724 RepID=A0A913XBS3_EXADI|nr:uncharacterized protein LOC110240578 [Exaiptasia diaphana]XP_028515306.1 uncharacterized protein LOC110240578 [Exaiptasia diaphana]KXJ26491.1 Tolloid-like protein 1 [Exaiptasia diaphana]
MDSTRLVNVLVLGILTLKFYTVPACDYAKLTGPDGHLASPRFPKYNPKATHCHWLISVETGHVITLQFEAFDVGQSTECSKFEFRKTYLEVRDGGNSSLGTFCGSVKPSDVRSTGNEMWIEYVTNGYKSTIFAARYHTTKESSVVRIVLFAMAAIVGTIICVVLIVILIRRKHRNLDDEMNSHVSPSHDSNHGSNRTCALAHIPSMILLGNVNKGMDDYVISSTQFKYASECSCSHGNKNHSHGNNINGIYTNRNRQELRCHDYSNYDNRNNHKDDMAIIDVESKHTPRQERLSPQSVSTSDRKTSESESILTTARVIFVQDSSSSRSGSSSSNE